MKFNKLLLMLSLLFLVLLMSCGDNPDVINSDNTDNISENDSNDESKDKYEHLKDTVSEEMKKAFKPEFLNRIDEIIVFHSLTRENIKDIVSIMFSKIASRAKEELNIKLKCTEEFDVKLFLSPRGNF